MIVLAAFGGFLSRRSRYQGIAMPSRHAGYGGKIFRPAAPLRRLMRIFAHCAQIMFSVLEVIFRRDPVAAQGFGAGQLQITLIISLGVLSGLCIRAAKPGRFSFLEPGVSRCCVGHILRLLARPCRRWLKFESGVHGSPYAAAAKAARRSFEGLSVRYNRRAHRAYRSNRKSIALWDVERVQQSTERIPVDATDVVSRVGDFKLKNRISS
jgi:hypothetical protein